jgi:alpha-1,2-mannosyltransferase
MTAVAVMALALRRARWLARCGDWLSAAVIAGAASVVVSPVSWTHHQIWLVMAALMPVSPSTHARRMWIVAILAIMVLPVTTVGSLFAWPVLEDVRLLAAITIACVVPIAARIPSAPERIRRVPGRDQQSYR